MAILQVTLLTPGRILWGKFFASWVAALAFLVTSAPFLVIAVVLGGMTPGHILVSLLMLAVELGVVCGSLGRWTDVAGLACPADPVRKADPGNPHRLIPHLT